MAEEPRPPRTHRHKGELPSVARFEAKDYRYRRVGRSYDPVTPYPIGENPFPTFHNYPGNGNLPNERDCSDDRDEYDGEKNSRGRGNQKRDRDSSERDRDQCRSSDRSHDRSWERGNGKDREDTVDRSHDRNQYRWKGNRDADSQGEQDNWESNKRHENADREKLVRKMLERESSERSRMDREQVTDDLRSPHGYASVSESSGRGHQIPSNYIESGEMGMMGCPPGPGPVMGPVTPYQLLENPFPPFHSFPVEGNGILPESWDSTERDRSDDRDEYDGEKNSRRRGNRKRDAKRETPPMYIQCDLRTTELSPDVFGTKFDVILVDPPWEEYVRRAPGSGDSMEWWPAEEIQNLRIEAIADTPAFIFLWVGDAEGLEQGRLCLEKWGFRTFEDICWVKSNRENPTPALRHDSNTLFQHSKEHCLMGIKGTVRPSTDGRIIHANVDSDIIVSEEPEYGSTKKPEELYHIIEHFAQGMRRIELFGDDHNIGAGWVTMGKGLTSSNFNRQTYSKNFEAFSSANLY